MPETPETKQARLTAFQAETSNLEKQCGLMEAEWLSLKEQCKAAKENYDEAINVLRARVREESSPSLFVSSERNEG